MLLPAHHVDLRAYLRPERIPEALYAFDQLLEDRRLEVVTDEDPGSLLAAFQHWRPGRFDWSMLEGRVGSFRVEICKHGVQTLTLTGYLERDHLRLDALLEQALALAKEAERELAALRFAEFRLGMALHMNMEEGVLLPALDGLHTAEHASLADAMGREHRKIVYLMEAVADDLQRGGLPAFEHSAAVLCQALSIHRADEERSVYPLVERALRLGQLPEELVGLCQSVMAPPAGR